MKKFLCAFAALTALVFVGANARPASADGFSFRISGPGYSFHSGRARHGHHARYHHRRHDSHHYRRGHHYFPHHGHVWHDTSHWDYVPGGFVRHYDHYDYVPGHWRFHEDGHWDHLHW